MSSVVIDLDLAARSGQALEGRRSQRDFVEALRGTWTAVTEGVEKRVATTMVAADRLPRGEGQTGGQVGEEATTMKLQVQFGSGRSAVERLGARMDEARRQVEAVCARVGRETVNIGVIGSTKAGKSTLLRTITGLPDSVIPSFDYDPTTAAPSRIYHTAGQA